MSDYMVVATFKLGTDMTQVMALVEEEKAAVKQLQDAGRIGKIYLAVPKGKVFIETLKTDEDGAHAAVSELPMSVFWELEAFPLSGRA
jgi:muconolactone delta-isomerase